MIDDDVRYLIENEAEGPLLDFKLENYVLGKGNSWEFLKDISAMANVLSDDDKYIIVGVHEEDGLAVGFKAVGDLSDEAQFQKYVIDNIEPEVKFEIKKISYLGNELVFFRVFGNKDRPYLFKKEVLDASNRNKFRVGDGFIRVGSSTRKMVRAHLDQIYQKKMRGVDRKLDIITRCMIKDSSSAKGFKYVDVTVFNVSHASIKIDVELRIRRRPGLLVSPLHHVQRKLVENDNNLAPHEKMIANASYLPSMTSSYKILEDCYKIETHGQSRLIKQESSIEDVLGQNAIIFVDNQDVDLQCEIIIRSDDFTEGMYREQKTLFL